MKQFVTCDQLTSLRERYPDAFFKLVNYYHKKYQLKDLSESTLTRVLSLGNVLDFINENRFSSGYESNLHVASNHKERQWIITLDGRTPSQAMELIDAAWFIVCDLLLDNKQQIQYH